MLLTKSKVDRVCDSCNSEGISVTAAGFCAVCEEAMCNNCLKFHRKQNISKSHTILTIEDLLNNLGHVMKSAEDFTCLEHFGKDLEFYCNNHKVACCGICSFESHKTCSSVQMLKEELPTLLRETNTSEIIEDLKNLETYLKTFIDMKESNIILVNSQVNGLANQIREMRQKFNSALDELEMKVVMEGTKILKEVDVRTQEETHQCLSLIHAIRNSQLRCETVFKYGIDIQKFLTADKIRSQLTSYYSVIREKYEKINTLTLQVKIYPLLESILSLSSSDIGNLVIMKDSTLCIPGLKKVKETQQMGQIFLAGGAGYFVPTMPQAAQRGFFTPQTMPQMRAGPRWLTVRTNQTAAQSGFQSMPAGPQVRPGHPTGTAQTNMRPPSVNVRAITGQKTTQPRATMPVTHSILSEWPAPCSVPPQYRPFKLPQQPPMHNIPQAVVVQGQEPLTSHMLASAPPQEQKRMLGERLFPLIQRMYPDLAGKITGMLLELDNSELLHMLESSESLKAKVEEAVAVLQAHQAKEAATRQAFGNQNCRKDST